MNEQEKQFVLLPQLFHLSKHGLEYLDILTYLTIRSHDNAEKGYAHPSLEAIAKKSGLGRTFISQSIQRLEAAGKLSIEHSTGKGTCNRYYFKVKDKRISKKDYDHFERIPLEIFDSSDLTTNEKAMLLCLRQLFNQGVMSCLMELKEIANYLGVSYSQLYHNYKALVAKNYISEHYILNGIERRLNNDKIDWRYTYKMKWFNAAEQKCTLKVT